MGIGFTINSAILAALTTAGLTFGGVSGAVHTALTSLHPTHPTNHGATVSAVAKGHGAAVSAVAKLSPSASPSTDHGTAVSAVANSHGVAVRAVAK